MTKEKPLSEKEVWRPEIIKDGLWEMEWDTGEFFFYKEHVKEAVERLKKVKVCPTKELWLEEIKNIFGEFE